MVRLFDYQNNRLLLPPAKKKTYFAELLCVRKYSQIYAIDTQKPTIRKWGGSNEGKVIPRILCVCKVWI